MTRGLAEESATGIAEEVHRTDGDLRFGLSITTAGEAAIGVHDEAPGEPEPQPEPAANPAASASAPASPRQTKAARVDIVVGYKSTD